VENRAPSVTFSKFSVIALIVAAGSALQAQTPVARIRVINANSGRPLPLQYVSVDLLYEKGKKAPAKYELI